MTITSASATRVLESGGSVPLADLRPAEELEYTAAVQIPQFEQQTQQQEYGLRLLLGQNPGRLATWIRTRSHQYPGICPQVCPPGCWSGAQTFCVFVGVGDATVVPGAGEVGFGVGRIAALSELLDEVVALCVAGELKEGVAFMRRDERARQRRLFWRRVRRGRGFWRSHRMHGGGDCRRATAGCAPWGGGRRRRGNGSDSSWLSRPQLLSSV